MCWSIKTGPTRSAEAMERGDLYLVRKLGPADPKRQRVLVVVSRQAAGWAEIKDNAGMTTLTLVPVNEYLQRSYEGVDREFVDGVVGERSIPTLLHSKVQGILCGLFFLLSRRFALVVAPELRLALVPRRLYRIPDVCVFVGPGPTDAVPSEPPLVAVEILSPDDRMADMLEKLREYGEFGIANIWMVNPEGRRLYRYDGDGLHPVGELELAEYEFVVRLDTLGL